MWIWPASFSRTRNSAPIRRPMLALLLQLQQTVFITPHPVLTHHPVLLQPEHLVELSRRGSSSVIIGCLRRRPGVAPVVLGDIVLPQIAIGLAVAHHPGQPQLLHQPVLMGAMP